MRPAAAHALRPVMRPALMHGCLIVARCRTPQHPACPAAACDGVYARCGMPAAHCHSVRLDHSCCGRFSQHPRHRTAGPRQAGSCRTVQLVSGCHTATRPQCGTWDGDKATPCTRGAGTGVALCLDTREKNRLSGALEGYGWRPPRGCGPGRNVRIGTALGRWTAGGGLTQALQTKGRARTCI